MKILDQYVDDVLTGKVTTGKLVKLACQRHRDDLQDPRFVWNEEQAQKACKFFYGLRHYEGKWARKPFALEPWQIFIIGSIFGWYNADGTRRYREAYVQIARKNGKTFLAAGVAAYLLLKDNEPGSQVYSCATKEEQARLVWRSTKFVIDAAPHLKKLTKLKHNTIEADGGRSFFRALGRDSKTQDGLNPHGAIGDEMHAWPDRSMYDVITSAFGARLQPLFLNITTAGLATDCFCYDYRKGCIDVLNGYGSGYDQPNLFAYIAEMDEEDDPMDERNWIKANPNLGVSVYIDTIRNEASKVRLMPSMKHGFLTKNLNMWVDSSESWFDLERWDRCKTDIDWSTMQGWECYGGLDLSTSTDFAAFAMLFPVGSGFVLKLHLWIPEESLRTQTKIRNARALDRICKWRDEGWITTTPGDWIDYDIIQHTIEDYAKRYQLLDLGFDPYNAGNLPNKLLEKNIKVTGITQGHRTLGGPTKDFEGMVLSGEMKHDGNPVLRWMLGNVILIPDTYGNNRPDKKKSHEKIDGVVAALMALQRAQNAEQQPKPGFHFL